MVAMRRNEPMIVESVSFFTTFDQVIPFLRMYFSQMPTKLYAVLFN